MLVRIKLILVPVVDVLFAQSIHLLEHACLVLVLNRCGQNPDVVEVGATLLLLHIAQLVESTILFLVDRESDDFLIKWVVRVDDGHLHDVTYAWC